MKPGFYRENGLRILCVVVFLLSFIWLGTRRTIESNSNSVEDWLPAQYQETRDYQWFLEHFPFESFIVASWEGCTLDDDRIELFAQKLVPEQTIDNFSLMAPVSFLRAELNLGTDPNEILAPVLPTNEAPAASTPPPSPSAPPEELYFRSVLTGPRLVRLLEQTYAKTPQTNRTAESVHEEILDRLEGTLIGPDGKSTAMIITLNTGFKGGGRKMQMLIDRVKEISVECGLPDTTEVQRGSLAARMVNGVLSVIDEMVNGRNPRTDALILGGPPTDNAALDREGGRTLSRLAVICMFVSLTIAILCLRDLRLTMFIFWVALLSAGLSLAMVSFTGGKCDSILLSMPAMVYVLAMSGAIHMVNYYHDAIRESGLPGATERAVRHAFTPCFFAQLTTAIGLGSLFLGQLVPITNFGFYSAIGVMASLLLLFFYLPALLDAFPSTAFAQKHGGKGLADEEGFIASVWLKIGEFIVRWHTVVVVACFTLMAVCAIPILATIYSTRLPETERSAVVSRWAKQGIPTVKTSVKMMNFFSPDAEIIAHYRWMEERLGPLIPMEVVLGFDNAKLSANQYGTIERLRLVTKISETLKTDLAEEIGGVLSVAMFTPDLDSVWNQGSMTHRIASSAIGKTINDNRRNLKDYLTIEGNPSLAELAAVVGEERKKALDEYTASRTLLAAQLAQAGENEAWLGPDMAQFFSGTTPPAPSSTNEKTPTAEEITQSAWAAPLQELHKKGGQIATLDRQERLLAEREAYLTENELVDLTTLTTRLEPGRPWRALRSDETTDLAAICRLWQDRKGIELWRISIRVWSLKKNIDYSMFIKDVKGVIEPILAATSDELMTQLAPNETPADRSADGVKLEQDFGADHSHDVIHRAGLSAKYTGMVPLVYKTQHALIHGLTNSLVMAFFLIALVIILILRSVAGGLVAMIPNLFPVVVVFGYMAWAGILVDVGTMMTASVAMGVAVDDTMHYITWFSDGIKRGDSPKEAAIWAYRRCATAMTQSTLIAGFGLSAFMFSTFVPTQRFGALMLAILFVALVGDLIFLPALLTSPVGRFFIGRKTREAVDFHDDESKEASA